MKTLSYLPFRAFLRVLVIAAVMASGLAAQAALRNIPAEAPATVMTMNMDGTVVLGKKTVALSPGAIIRDADNRIVLPVNLSGPYKVRVLLNADGQLERAWILTGEEAALPAPKF